MSSGGGKGAENTPSLFGETLGNMDPIGNAITSWGGDPLNFYGNGNNPNAALFPSGSAASPLPGTLPQPNVKPGAGGINPYSWGAPAPAGAGPFNAMAGMLAGPVFTGGLQVPGVSPGMQGQALPSPGWTPPGSGKGGAAAPGGGAQAPGGLNLQALRARLGLDQGGFSLPYRPGFAGARP